MAVKEFKAESKRLLDLMINSIYTHKEIFLRELISNASDAIDKLYYHALNEGITGLNRDDFAIDIAIDKENKTLTISDNGCGMSKEELENNLGTIAKSGSFAFKNENEKNENIDIIGQFGVGFYSAFMVSDDVTVTTKKYGENQAYCWNSKGADGYTITECEKDSHGTVVVLKIKPSTEDENYDEYLDSYRISALVRKYSDYIRYPIKMDVEHSVPKDDEGKEFETITENETINSMVPLWKKNKNEITTEEYNNFYKEKYFDYQEPLKVIHTQTEGSANYNALMFIPKTAPFNYYSKNYEKGLALYASGVMIMEKCADLLPDYFSFVRGLVDSQDLSLNISRELLQHDRQLKLIATRIEKKIKSELENMLKNERESYEEFFKVFGLQLKFGIYSDYGTHKDMLKDIVIFSNGEKMVTLKEYVDLMKEEQKYIYYACGTSVEQIKLLPQIELLQEKGYEVLYLTDDIDEFVIKTLAEYEGKQFKSIADGDLGLDTQEDKKELEEKIKDNEKLFTFMQNTLNNKVQKVTLSSRLKSHPVCLSTQGAVSIEMEKVLNSMPGNEKVSAEKVLEINASHPVFETLKSLLDEDNSKLEMYTKLLYNQALLIEGMNIENPVEFSNDICNLMK